MNKLEINYVSTDSLRPYAGNARTHSKKQIRQIADSIERFGFANPILVSDEREVMAGHGRLSAAKLLNLASVPLSRYDGSRPTGVYPRGIATPLRSSFNSFRTSSLPTSKLRAFLWVKSTSSLTRRRKRARTSPVPTMKFPPQSVKPMFR